MTGRREVVGELSLVPMYSKNISASASGPVWLPQNQHCSPSQPKLTYRIESLTALIYENQLWLHQILL